MKLTGSVHLLTAERLEPCLDFYCSALQFVILKQRHSEQGLEWVYLASGDVLLMLQRGANPRADTASQLYIYTDDASTLQHYLQAKGHAVSEIQLTPYGMKEFTLIDPVGHRLCIGEKC